MDAASPSAGAPRWRAARVGAVALIVCAGALWLLLRGWPGGPGAALTAAELAVDGPATVAARRSMVEDQLRRPTDGRDPVTDARVLAALQVVPRHLFVPERLRPHAHADGPLPIGRGQTISQPYIVGLMSELLALKPGESVLEVGTGSGYQAAVLAELGARVASVEILAPLAEEARARLERLGYGDRVRVRCADGYHGWPELGPFDAIIVTCAAGHLPPPLWAQLQPGGRIVIPIGRPYAVQRLVRIDKTADGQRRSRTVTMVSFVPMTGRAARD